MTRVCNYVGDVSLRFDMTLSSDNTPILHQHHSPIGVRFVVDQSLRHMAGDDDMAGVHVFPQ